MEYIIPLFVLLGYLQCFVLGDVTLLTEDQEFTAESEKYETLSLPCQVTGSDYNPMLTSIMFYKELPNGERVEVSQGTKVKSPFIDTNRYTIEYVQPDFTDWKLTIAEVRVGDSGVYVCEADGLPDARPVRHTVTVFQNIEDMTMLTDALISSTPEGVTVFTFERDREEPYSITCTVKGGHPRPDVSMHLDDDKLRRFKLDETTYNYEDLHEALDETFYELVKSDNEFVPAAEYDGKTLMCRARITDSPYDKIEKTALLKVHYPPTFTCDDLLHAEVGHKDFQITCQVAANPSVLMESIQWEWDDDENNNTVVFKLDQDERGFLTSAELREDGTVEARLHVRVVNATDFRTYSLTAGNAKHSLTKTITLSEKTPGKPPYKHEENSDGESDSVVGDDGGVASATSFSAVVTLATLLIALML